MRKLISLIGTFLLVAVMYSETSAQVTINNTTPCPFRGRIMWQNPGLCNFAAATPTVILPGLNFFPPPAAGLVGQFVLVYEMAGGLFISSTVDFSCGGFPPSAPMMPIGGCSAGVTVTMLSNTFVNIP